VSNGEKRRGERSKVVGKGMEGGGKGRKRRRKVE
jgi:hypothetical protein